MKSGIASTRRSRNASACAKKRSSNTSSISSKSASSSCVHSSPLRSYTSQTRSSSQVQHIRHQTKTGPSMTRRGRTGTCSRTAMASGVSDRSWTLRTVSRRATALYSTLRQLHHVLQNNRRPHHQHHQHLHQPLRLPQSSPRHQCMYQNPPPSRPLLQLPSPSSSRALARASSHYPNQPKSSSSTATAKSSHQSPSKSSQQQPHVPPPTQTTNPSECASSSQQQQQQHDPPRQSYQRSQRQHHRRW